MKRLMILLLLTLVFAGCTPQESRLVDGYRSTDDLGKAVVNALNTKDSEGLYKLCVTKDVYAAHVFPSFPASKYNFTADFAFSNMNKNTLIGVKRGINRHGGQNLSFVDLKFTEPSETYDGFRLHNGTVLTVRNEDGKEIDLDFVGVVIEMDRQYKILGFNKF